MAREEVCPEHCDHAEQIDSETKRPALVWKHRVTSDPARLWALRRNLAGRQGQDGERAAVTQEGAAPFSSSASALKSGTAGLRERGGAGGPAAWSVRQQRADQAVDLRSLKRCTQGILHDCRSRAAWGRTT